MRNLTLYKPNSFDLFRINDDIDSIIDSFFKTSHEYSGSGGSWAPAADVIEEKDKYVIKVELPGVKKEEIKITADDGVLTLKGERKYENESKDKHVRRAERSYGVFTRTFNLPKGIERDKIEADYTDGVLEISLPKLEETKPKEIAITVH